MSESRYIRLRGLPWSVTNQEILDFLKGVKVVDGIKGITLVTNRWDGKSTGEAFVQLETEEDEEEAFKHNKENMGHRYIEIFSASTEEAEHAIHRPGQQTSNVVKLRGLPYLITEVMIEEFFEGLEIKPDREGILIIMDRRGRATGEAYVQFETQEDTKQALKLNREKIGHRYIEIFRSSVQEMRRQMNGNRPGPYDLKDRGGSRGSNNDFGRGSRNRPREVWANSFGNNGFGDGGGNGNFGNGGNNFGNGGGGGGSLGGLGSSIFGGNFGGGNSGGFGDFKNFGNRNDDFNDFGGSFSNNMRRRNDDDDDDDDGDNRFGNGFFGNSGRMMGGGGGGSGSIGGGNSFRNNMASGFGSFGRNNDDEDSFYCVHMRGLPYYCFESDVNRFFEPLTPINVKIIYNNKGLHSGSADAFFETHEDAVLAMKKHREKMGSRYIELFYDGKGKRDGGGGGLRRL